MDNYLYEIIEDYKYAASEEAKDAVFQAFCTSIWSSNNKRRVYTKTIRFSIRKDLLHTDIGKIFDTWSDVEYTGYKAKSKETDWCSLIRQKINNLYTRYFDKEVILKQDYMYLLHTPKRLYYQWLNGSDITSGELSLLIDNAMDAAEKLKISYQQQKMCLSWMDYKKVIEGIFHKIFRNCIFIDDYNNTGKCNTIYDFINEDNFYISYFCKYLESEMKQWQKKYYGVRTHQKYKRCILCGNLMEQTGCNQKYCSSCKRKKQLEWQRNSMKKARCEVL